MSSECLWQVSLSLENCVSISPSPLTQSSPVWSLSVHLSVCLSASWMSAYQSISLSICLPPQLLVCSAAFQPGCLGPLLNGDKLARWQPEAICHPGPFLLCSCQLSASVWPVPFWFVPCGRHITLIQKINNKRSLQTDIEADCCEVCLMIINGNDNRPCYKNLCDVRNYKKQLVIVNVDVSR